MKSRAFLMTALLASSAWAQQPSFDFKSDAIKKIVHDVAASQSVPVHLAEAKPVARKRVLEAEDVRPLETPTKITLPRPIAAPKSRGPVSALIDVLVDSALGVKDEPTPEHAIGWLTCQSREDLKFPAPGCK